MDTKKNNTDIQEVVEYKFKCPLCQYPQHCPCDACKDRKPASIMPWRWIDGELIACSKCGHVAHADWWADEEYRQYEEFKKIHDGKKTLCGR